MNQFANPYYCVQATCLFYVEKRAVKTWKATQRAQNVHKHTDLQKFIMRAVLPGKHI